MTLLNGTNGADILAGGPLDETLSGGLGNDILTGGDGVNTFVFANDGDSNVDTITDYKLTSDPLTTGDTIDLSALLAAHFTAGSKVSDFVRIAYGPYRVRPNRAGAGRSGRHREWRQLAGRRRSPGLRRPPNPDGGDTVKVHFNSTDYLISTGDAAGLHVTALGGGGWVVTWDQSAWQDVAAGHLLHRLRQCL